MHFLNYEDNFFTYSTKLVNNQTNTAQLIPKILTSKIKKLP